MVLADRLLLHTLKQVEHRHKLKSIMGWKGKVVGKLGNLLSQSVEVPLKHLYDYAAARGHINAQTEGLRYQSTSNLMTTADAQDEYGPDTSSLTAFLLSLLTSDNNDPRCSGNLSGSEENTYDEDCPSTSGALSKRTEKDQTVDMIYEGIPDDILQGFKHHSENEDLSVLVSKHNSAENQSYVLQSQESFTKAEKLPPLSEASLLLPERFRAYIYSALPILVKDKHWILLYSTAKHGISLRTLYRRSAALPPPFLLVVGDFHGATFGSLATAPLKPVNKRKHQGTNDMFVFTNAHGRPQIFRATGANRYYFLCMNDAISFGGGGHFALHLDEDLLNGSSGSCETFGSHCLASAMTFSIANVEVWGFAHVSRYGSNPGFRELSF